jgi:hypothetical protein
MLLDPSGPSASPYPLGWTKVGATYRGQGDEAVEILRNTGIVLASALVIWIGVAMITKYLPALSKRDRRFGDITIRDLLLMSSGLDYVEFRRLLFNSDDILTSYYPDQREISLENIQIIDPPGAYCRYNKYHPQLLGMILERT